jgi:hypothetical protein
MEALRDPKGKFAAPQGAFQLFRDYGMPEGIP